MMPICHTFKDDLKELIQRWIERGENDYEICEMLEDEAEFIRNAMSDLDR